MKLLLISLFGALLSILCYAKSGDTGIAIPKEDKIERWGSIYENDGGLEDIPLKLEIDVSKIGNQPSWKSEEDNPPLSAKRARNIALEFIDNRLATFPNAQWLLTRLALVPLKAMNGDIWCWQCSFVLRRAGIGANHHPRASIYVLMDGSIIEPVEDPPDDKKNVSTIFKVKE